MRIARVFPTRTAQSPDDEDAYFGPPGLFTPEYDEVHVSVSFTWDIERADQLAREWQRISRIVRIDGPAISGEPGGEFVPGMYLRKGVTITSRGCPNRCAFCAVRSPVKELVIKPGHIVQDNNLLACSDKHVDAVFEMLKREHGVRFQGGLEASRVTERVVDLLRSISVNEIWLAFDDESRRKSLVAATDRLRRHFNREILRCFVLVGFKDDTFDAAEERCREAFSLGTLPFAMLFRAEDGSYPKPEREWRDFQRIWTRPAIMKSRMRSDNE